MKTAASSCGRQHQQLWLTQTHLLVLLHYSLSLKLHTPMCPSPFLSPLRGVRQFGLCHVWDIPDQAKRKGRQGKGGRKKKEGRVFKPPTKKVPDKQVSQDCNQPRPNAWEKCRTVKEKVTVDGRGWGNGRLHQEKAEYSKCKMLKNTWKKVKSFKNAKKRGGVVGRNDWTRLA